MRFQTRTIIAIAVLLGVLCLSSASFAGGNVLPPWSHPYGKTYAEWGAAWQQWLFRTTTANCPVTDNTGARALVGQSGPVYFLAGTFGEYPGTPWAAPNPVTRNVTLPPRKALCIPINNWGLIYPEDLPFANAPPDATPEEAMFYFYETLDATYNNTPEANLLCEVDGVAVKHIRCYRARSEPFWVYVPRDNVQNDVMDYVMGTHPCYPDPQPWYPFYAKGWHLSVSDGYYVMLAPLSAGHHTIHCLTGWTDQDGEFHLFCNVYYKLTVKRK